MTPMALIDDLRRRVVDVDMTALTRPHRAAVFAARIAMAVARDLAGGMLTLRAMSLVYTTLLSLVPLLAVSFSVLKAFGVHNQIEPTLVRLLAPLGPRGAEITERIVEFVENIRVGVLGAVGLALLIYTVVALMQKVEQAFNATWRVRRHRRLAQRFSDYLSVVLVGPVLVFLAIGITASVLGSETVQELSELAPFGALLEFGARLAPYVVIIAAFTFVYLFVPNTRVRPASALAGALVAGVLWQSMGWMFAAFVAGSTRYTAIYSAFATLIVFMFWLYLSWLILLVGASVAYYHQHPARTLLGGEPVLSPRLRERVALAVMASIARAFYQRRPPPNTEQLAGSLSLPVTCVAEIQEQLAAAGLLTVMDADEEPLAYTPGTPPERTSLAEVVRAVREAGEAHGRRVPRVRLGEAVTRLGARLDDATEAALGEATVRDLVDEAEAVSALPPRPSAEPAD